MSQAVDRAQHIAREYTSNENKSFKHVSTETEIESESNIENL
jgi:hypothetical protein